MKLLKYFLIVFVALLLLLIGFVVSMITSMDWTPYQEMSYYKSWKTQIAQVKADTSGANEKFRVGWAKINITPPYPTPMAGYGNRKGKPFVSVHDSIYVRTMVIESNGKLIALVASDLLITPPTVTVRLQSRLTSDNIPFDQVFFGATHSHNSVGGWGTGLAGLFFSGAYDQATVDRLTDAIVLSISEAKKSLIGANIRYQEAIDKVDIRNRLVGEEGTVDPEIRSLIITREDGQTAILSSYAAHSTIIDSNNMVLSRDYPGVLVDSLEHGHYSFAMYMAGALGSMGPIERGTDDFDEMKNEAFGVQSAMLKADTTAQVFERANLQAITLPLPLRKPSPRLTMRMVLRPWAFEKAFGNFPVFIKAARIGTILMVGTPCDFSGELVAELDNYAKSKGLHLMITSFNGGYVGYITSDKYFDRDLYETKTMSWYGPYNGAYFQEVIKDIIDKLS